MAVWCVEYWLQGPGVGEPVEMEVYAGRARRVDSHRVEKVEMAPPVKQDELDYEV